MKTKIFSFVFNRPDLLKKQYNTFKKNIIGDFEFIVICDYREDTYLYQFENICNENNIKFYKHKSQNGLGSSQYHGLCMNWVYQEIILKNFREDLIFFIDHDIFLLKCFDPIMFMNDADVAGQLQTRGQTDYIWPGLLFFKMSKCRNIKFDFLPCISPDGVQLDTGGGTHKLIKGLKYKSTDVKYISKFKNTDLSKYDEGYGFEFHLDNKFLHFRNACRWDNNYKAEHNSQKVQILDFLLEDLNDIDIDANI